MTGLRLAIVLTVLTAINISVAQQNQAPAERPMSAGELNTRYAQIYLDLAKLQFQRALDSNKQVPGTFTNSSIEAIRQVVMIAEEQLKSLQQTNGRSANTYLISSEMNARAAEAAFNRTRALSQAKPGIIAPAEIEQLRLNAELANINLQKAKSFGAESSPEYIQWQLDQIREDVFQLRNQVTQVSRIN